MAVVGYTEDGLRVESRRTTSAQGGHVYRLSYSKQLTTWMHQPGPTTIYAPGHNSYPWP